jgi:sRNA-binding protein
MSMRYVENIELAQTNRRKKSMGAEEKGEDPKEEAGENAKEEAAEAKAEADAPKKKKKNLADTEVPAAKEVITKKKGKKAPMPSIATLVEPMDMSTEQTLDQYKTELNRPFDNPPVLDAGAADGHSVDINIIGRGVQ